MKDWSCGPRLFLLEKKQAFRLSDQIGFWMIPQDPCMRGEEVDVALSWHDARPTWSFKMSKEPTGRHNSSILPCYCQRVVKSRGTKTPLKSTQVLETKTDPMISLTDVKIIKCFDLHKWYIALSLCLPQEGICTKKPTSVCFCAQLCNSQCRVSVRDQLIHLVLQWWSLIVCPFFNDCHKLFALYLPLRGKIFSILLFWQWRYHISIFLTLNVLIDSIEANQNTSFKQTREVQQKQSRQCQSQLF